MWLRFAFGLVLAFGLVEAAAAQGPAGSTGAIASIPGPIVRWQPGDPVPPGLFAILTSPSHLRSTLGEKPGLANNSDGSASRRADPEIISILACLQCDRGLKLRDWAPS
jgi:hypothetical protein